MTQDLKTYQIRFNDPFELGDGGQSHLLYTLQPNFEAAVGWVVATFPGCAIEPLIAQVEANRKLREQGQVPETRVGNQLPVSVIDAQLFSRCERVGGKLTSRPSLPGENDRTPEQILNSWQACLEALHSDFEALISSRNYLNRHWTETKNQKVLQRAVRANRHAEKCTRWIEHLTREWVRQQRLPLLSWAPTEVQLEEPSP